MTLLKTKDFTLDISELARYLGKVNEIGSMNKMMAATYLRDFIEAQDIASNMLAAATYKDIQAKQRLEQLESIAYLDKAATYLNSKGIKDTSEARKQYISIDPDVITAADEKAQTEALVLLLKNKLSILRQAHDDVRKIAYGDTQMTAYEGM